MPSRFPTRRQLLSASGGCLSVALAGCAGFGASGSVTESGVDDGSVESTHEYESLFVRSSDETPVAYPSADAAEEAADRRGRPHYSTFFVTDADEADAMRIAVDGEDAADAYAFVDATDFETEAVVVDQRRIDDCYYRRLLSVRARDDSFRTRYCRDLKAPTTPCEADKTVVEAVFVRVHRPYDEAPSSRGSSQGTSCPARDDRTDNGSAGNETDGTDGRDDGTAGANETSDGGATNGGESQ